MDEKIKLDWKAPSDVKMKDIVVKLDDEKKKAFAKECVEKKDGKNTINKSKAKKWIDKNCKDYVEWKNYPKGGSKLSSADEIASWLDL